MQLQANGHVRVWLVAKQEWAERPPVDARELIAAGEATLDAPVAKDARRPLTPRAPTAPVAPPTTPPAGEVGEPPADPEPEEPESGSEEPSEPEATKGSRKKK